MERNHISFGFCNMSGKLFVLANEKGYESEAFIESLMNSQVGEHLYHSPYTEKLISWRCWKMKWNSGQGYA